MIKKTARLITTLRCNYDCNYCCNKKESVKRQMLPLKDLKILKEFEEVVITGGEPLLNINKTLFIIGNIKTINPTAKIYLYTSGGVTLAEREYSRFGYDKKLISLFKLIDGLTYTIHPSDYSANIFNNFQELLKIYTPDICRLTIDPNMGDINIVPWLWCKVKLLEVQTECPVPGNEILFILDDITIDKTI